MLDLAKLENVRRRGGKIEARCPACAEMGADRSGNHLFVGEDGKYGCIVATGTDGAEHRKRIFALAGDGTAPAKANPRPFKAKRAAPEVRLCTERFRAFTFDELGQIARSRCWSYYVGLQLLHERGLLHAADVWDDGKRWPAWVACDSTRRNADARRNDGQVWQGIRGKKAKALAAGARGWPIGCDRLGAHEMVILTEGVPDFAAALLVGWWEGVSLAPVCMTGAANQIDAEALPYFAGKHVRIAMHNDANEAGRRASERWGKQLTEAGAATVDRINFAGATMANGEPVEDLADFATLLGTDLPDAPRVLLTGRTSGMHEPTYEKQPNQHHRTVRGGP